MRNISIISKLQYSTLILNITCFQYRAALIYLCFSTNATNDSWLLLKISVLFCTLSSHELPPRIAPRPPCILYMLMSHSGYQLYLPSSPTSYLIIRYANFLPLKTHVNC